MATGSPARPISKAASTIPTSMCMSPNIGFARSRSRASTSALRSSGVCSATGMRANSFRAALIRMVSALRRSRATSACVLSWAAASGGNAGMAGMTAQTTISQNIMTRFALTVAPPCACRPTEPSGDNGSI